MHIINFNFELTFQETTNAITLIVIIIKECECKKCCCRYRPFFTWNLISTCLKSTYFFNNRSNAVVVVLFPSQSFQIMGILQWWARPFNILYGRAIIHHNSALLDDIIIVHVMSSSKQRHHIQKEWNEERKRARFMRTRHLHPKCSRSLTKE